MVTVRPVRLSGVPRCQEAKKPIGHGTRLFTPEAGHNLPRKKVTPSALGPLLQTLVPAPAPWDLSSSDVFSGATGDRIDQPSRLLRLSCYAAGLYSL